MKPPLKSSSIIAPSTTMLFYVCLFLYFMSSGSLIRSLHPLDDGDRQENEDPYFVDVPKGDNDEGKS